MGALVSGTGGYFLHEKASTNTRALIFHGLELSREQATIFWWVLTWALLAFIPLAVGLLLLRVLNPQKLTLTRGGLIACRWPWSAPALIPYGSIHQVSTYVVQGKGFAKIAHAAGKQTIASTWMESQEAFQDFCVQLADRIHAAREETVQQEAASVWECGRLSEA
jgi:hypothetical protein